MSILNHPLRRKKREAGNAMVEVALMAPWIFFLFVGIFDFGFERLNLTGIVCQEADRYQGCVLKNRRRVLALELSSAMGRCSTRL